MENNTVITSPPVQLPSLTMRKTSPPSGNGTVTSSEFYRMRQEPYHIARAKNQKPTALATPVKEPAKVPARSSTRMGKLSPVVYALMLRSSAVDAATVRMRLILESATVPAFA